LLECYLWVESDGPRKQLNEILEYAEYEAKVQHDFNPFIWRNGILLISAPGRAGEEGTAIYGLYRYVPL